MKLLHASLILSAQLTTLYAADLPADFSDQLSQAVAASLADMECPDTSNDAALAETLTDVIDEVPSSAFPVEPEPDYGAVNETLIAAIQAQDLAGLDALAIAAPPSVFEIIQIHPRIAEHRAALAPIYEHLGTIPQNADVHVLDGFVEGRLDALHAMGDDFGVDNPALTTLEMRTYLVGFLDAHPGFYAGYEGQAVTHEQLVGYIDAALARANEQVSTLRMYSRVISLIRRLGSEDIDNRNPLKHLFDAVAENYLTQGGCFQGVRNRIFVMYANLMNTLMSD